MPSVPGFPQDHSTIPQYSLPIETVSVVVKPILLLRKDRVVCARICLEAIVDALVLLHVHRVQDVHREAFSEFWCIWRR